MHVAHAPRGRGAAGGALGHMVEADAVRDPAPVAPPAARVPRGRACLVAAAHGGGFANVSAANLSAHLAASAAPAALGNVTLVARFGATAAAAGLADCGACAECEKVLANETAPVSARALVKWCALRAALSGPENCELALWAADLDALVAGATDDIAAQLDGGASV